MYLVTRRWMRRKRDFRLLHREDDRLVFLQIRDDRQQCEDQQINEPVPCLQAPNGCLVASQTKSRTTHVGARASSLEAKNPTEFSVELLANLARRADAR